MNFANYIAHRWAGSSPLRHTRAILRMGIGSMAICITVMMVSVCILHGFKQEIQNKVFGFGSHLVIQPYFPEESQENSFIRWDENLKERIYQSKEVAAVSPFAHKGALVRGKEESHGVMFKGLTQGFDSVFFQQKLIKGRVPDFSVTMGKNSERDILISELLARKLKIDTGDKLRAYFVDQGQLRPRAFEVKGIYSSGLEKFDETYIFCHLSCIQDINRWNPDQAEGLDIQLYHPEKRFEVHQELSQLLPYEYSCYPCDYLFPEIFDWLILIDANVWVILIIMLIVCMICMISVLFILIIERKPHIGILKSLGAGNKLIRKIFVHQTMIILGRSLLIGNILALVLTSLQKATRLIRLDESVYYIDSVPIAFPWLHFAWINLAILLIAYILLCLLSLGVRRLSPASMNRE